MFSNSAQFVFAHLLYSLFFTDSRTKLFALPNLSVLIKFQTQRTNKSPVMASLQTAGRKEIKDAISTGVIANLCIVFVFFVNICIDAHTNCVVNRQMAQIILDKRRCR